jgi:hypothetical protein
MDLRMGWAETGVILTGIGVLVGYLQLRRMKQQPTYKIELPNDQPVPNSPSGKLAVEIHKHSEPPETTLGGKTFSEHPFMSDSYIADFGTRISVEEHAGDTNIIKVKKE